MKNISRLIVISLSIALTFSACKKEEENEEENMNTNSEVLLKLFAQHAWDGSTFEYDRDYVVNDTEVRFSEIRYYLSNFVAMGMDMESMTAFDEVLLLDAGVGGTQTLGSTDLPHVHMMSFNIGLDEETNHADPLIAEAPLNDPLMHWGWNPDAGYKFIKIEGEYKINGSEDFETFSIHVATDAMLRSASKTVHADLNGEEVVLFLKVDLEEWFENVDFSTLAGTHGGGETAAAVADATSDSFEINTTLEVLNTDLSVMFHHDWNGSAFETNQIYDIEGVDVRFSEIRYYLSNFSAMDDEMNSMDYPTVLLMDASNAMSTESIGVIDLDHLHMLNFIIGLDEETNHEDPTIAEEPLNDPLMHWSWNPDAGYKFIKIEGEHDADSDGTFEAFSIHVATDALARSVSSMIHEDIDGDLVLHCHVNLDQWFASVNFSELDGTHGDGITTNSLADAADDSFNFED